MKRVLVRLFLELHINEHRESDGHSRRPRNNSAGSSSAYQTRDNASYPRRYRSALATGHEWADTESVDDETDVNSADLQGFVRSELEAPPAGIDDFASDLSSVFTHEESAKLENAAMKLSAVPEALVTIRAARDKMKGKSEGHCRNLQSHFLGRARESGGNPAQPIICKTSWLRGRPSQRVTNVDNVVTNALQREKQISLLGQMVNCSQIGSTAEPSWRLSGLKNLVFFFPVQICVSIPFARILSRIFDVLLSTRTSQFPLLPLTPFLRHAQLILKKFVVL